MEAESRLVVPGTRRKVACRVTDNGDDISSWGDEGFWLGSDDSFTTLRIDWKTLFLKLYTLKDGFCSEQIISQFFKRKKISS